LPATWGIGATLLCRPRQIRWESQYLELGTLWSGAPATVDFSGVLHFDHRARLVSLFARPPSEARSARVTHLTPIFSHGRNLGLIEPGLQLYDEEGITGVEFPVGGRFIDILAVDKDGSYVVVELKVSRGYDRVVGQLLRYMAWVEQNMEAARPVRGVIVAKEITADLKLASSRIPDIRLIEYEISFKLRLV
jgi:hypothetical protein